ncbi:unnamed protein product [Ambrosiozyma monospora]|uniref:Unnamed protein product n=1 Tax=Ambrosiozyma monospora TaxID=43982 RepID=A0ACB5SUU6_AMBMO|nr:unnamed protein product [Ambrosiozyma monospora]
MPKETESDVSIYMNPEYYEYLAESIKQDFEDAMEELKRIPGAKSDQAKVDFFNLPFFKSFMFELLRTRSVFNSESSDTENTNDIVGRHRAPLIEDSDTEEEDTSAYFFIGKIDTVEKLNIGSVESTRGMSSQSRGRNERFLLKERLDILFITALKNFFTFPEKFKLRFPSYCYGLNFSRTSILSLCVFQQKLVWFYSGRFQSPS